MGGVNGSCARRYRRPPVKRAAAAAPHAPRGENPFLAPACGTRHGTSARWRGRTAGRIDAARRAGGSPRPHPPPSTAHRFLNNAPLARRHHALTPAPPPFRRWHAHIVRGGLLRRYLLAVYGAILLRTGLGLEGLWRGAGGARASLGICLADDGSLAPAWFSACRKTPSSVLLFLTPASRFRTLLLNWDVVLCRAGAAPGHRKGAWRRHHYTGFLRRVYRGAEEDISQNGEESRRAATLAGLFRARTCGRAPIMPSRRKTRNAP